MRIAVCDDVPVYVEQLKKYIERWSAGRGIHVQLATFQNGEEVLFDLEAEGDFSAVFMDILFYGMDGIEAAVRIREQNPQTSIVFISQYREYFNEMFRIYPFQYIEKPVTKQEIYKVLDKILEEQRISYETFGFRYNRITYNIALWQVIYFVSDRRRIRVVMEDGKELIFYGKLDSLEKKLSTYNHYFVRIHQSYLVNERQMETCFHNRIRMRNGDLLPVSREKKNFVKELCMEL